LLATFWINRSEYWSFFSFEHAYFESETYWISKTRTVFALRGEFIDENHARCAGVFHDWVLFDNV
jgi:hypothetical protein